MSDVLYLAWRYLAYHKIKTAILVTSITLILYLPVGLRVLVDQSSEQLTARAGSTPLIVGAKGSPLELVLNSLYFGSDMPESLPHAEATRVDIKFEYSNERLYFEIKDNGRGSSVEQRAKASEKGSFGLTSMQARIAARGGQFSMDSELGEGTQISGWLPIL